MDQHEQAFIQDLCDRFNVTLTGANFEDPEGETDEVYELHIREESSGQLYHFYYEESESRAFAFKEPKSFQAVHEMDYENFIKKASWDSQGSKTASPNEFISCLVVFLYDLVQGNLKK